MCACFAFYIICTHFTLKCQKLTFETLGLASILVSSGFLKRDSVTSDEKYGVNQILKLVANRKSMRIDVNQCTLHHFAK